MRISLFCSFGMSTGVLVCKMKQYAAEGDVIEAYDINRVEEVVQESDVVLLGPQARLHLNRVKKLCDKLGIPCEVISMEAYGRGNGEAVYQQAKLMFETKTGGGCRNEK